ncbi:MAG: ABC transporter permease [Acidobacteriaceae bacterium]
MATSSLALATHAANANLLRLFLNDTRCEFLKLFRRQSCSLSVIGFPVRFYLLFGVTNRHVGSGSFHIAKYLLGGYACFGLVGAALFGIGVGLAMERSAGWLDLKRTSPMPPIAYLAAKCITAAAFGLAIVCILVLLGIFFGGVSLTPGEFARMLAVTVAGAPPFASMGLLLALVIPANATPGIVNLIYLPMSFLSGLWMPLNSLPHWLQRIAPVFPTYHLAQAMLSVFGYAAPGSLISHWVSLAGFTFLMLGASWLVFQRAERNA